MSRKVNVWTVDFTEGRRIGMEDGIVIGKYIAVKILEEFMSDRKRMFNYIGHAEEFINDFKNRWRNDYERNSN